MMFRASDINGQSILKRSQDSLCLIIHKQVLWELLFVLNDWNEQLKAAICYDNFEFKDYTQYNMLLQDESL